MDKKNILTGLVVGVFFTVIASLIVWGIASVVKPDSAPSTQPIASGHGNEDNNNSLSIRQIEAALATDHNEEKNYSLSNQPDGTIDVKLKSSKTPFGINFPDTLADPITVSLDKNRTIQIIQKDAEEFIALPKDEKIETSQNQKLLAIIQKDPILSSYRANSDNLVFYTYQKNEEKNQSLFKNWILISSPRTNQVAYEIQNATININSSGDAEVFFADGGDLRGKSADFIIPKPYFLDKDTNRNDLNWQFDNTKKILFANITAAPEQYPIAIDPSVLKTDTVIGTFSGKAISMHGSCGAYTVTGRSPDTTVYQTVLGEDGHCWLKSNLGTSHVATAYNDSAAYGWYYQWGRLTDGHQIPTSGTTTTLSSSDVPGHANFIKPPSSPYDWRSPQNNNLWQGVDGTNNPCPIGWRVPTQAEWAAEVSAAGITNYTTAFSSALKLTAAGYRYYTDGVLSEQGNRGYYWTSSAVTSSAYSLWFHSGGLFTDYLSRGNGFTIRCLQD